MRGLTPWYFVYLPLVLSAFSIVAADDTVDWWGVDSDGSGESRTSESNEWAVGPSDTAVEDSFSEEVALEDNLFYFDKEEACSRPIPRMGRSALESSQGKRRPIRTVCVTGERHSGTNFLHALLEQNFKYSDTVYLPTVSFVVSLSLLAKKIHTADVICLSH
eukprot:3769757-Pyramimonas_sp.AAC.2